MRLKSPEFTGNVQNGHWQRYKIKKVQKQKKSQKMKGKNPYCLKIQ